MYAIVRCGGRQEKASVDDVLTVDLLAGEVGSTLTLPAVLVVDGDQVVSDPAELGGYQISAEIVGAAAGPKISMIRYKNKTGYRRRLGHRQHYTQVRVTSITKGGTGRPARKPAAAAKAEPASKPAAAAKAEPASKPATAAKAEPASKPATAAKAQPASKPATAARAQTAKEG